MVARIKRTQSLSRSVNYNEKKVQQGVAQCLQAVNYPKDLEHLNFYDKLHRLEHQAELNERVVANSVHISLNFHQSDALNKEKLCEIAEDYMEGIGFEKQPYLVYQHHDAGHPHIHIVSTNIQRDGSKIDMHNIGRKQSEAARKAIELKFKLTQAEGRGQKQENNLTVSPQRVQYGKTPTKQAIQNVLSEVIPNYRYTSLPELNAILKQYNVMADRGKEDTKMYEKRGLMYTVIDGKGNKIGTPIKASAFYGKPTLQNLEKRFVQNEPLRQAHQKRLWVAVKMELMKKKETLGGFTEAMAREGVAVVLRQNAQGIIYGLTYVDFKTKCVFNGSDLGKEFTAKGVLEQLSQQQKPDELKQGNAHINEIKQQQAQAQQQGFKHERDNDYVSIQKSASTLELLLKSEYSNNNVPSELLKKKKKQSKGLRM